MSSPDSVALEGAMAADEALDDLVRRAQQGEEAAFEEILARFEGKALAIAHQMGASRADAEDIAQEAFIKLLKHIGSYGGGRRFTAWFYRIVVNAARDHIRRAGPVMQDLDAAGPEAAPSEGAGQEAYHRIRQALLVLSPREREVIVLRDLHGLSTWQVARALRLNPVTVRRHAMRARARLRDLLGI
ncbi:MAG TPA: sigma-70 family RNA polymerase sigma factor [Candidatus Saccharimonadales bacterium]|nr:sigma-70 family RNA polymerase sigma factor [Candidatus Saccharimonadales bacterium]